MSASPPPPSLARRTLPLLWPALPLLWPALPLLWPALLLVAAGCATPNLASVRLDEELDWATLQAQRARAPRTLRLGDVRTHGLDARASDEAKLHEQVAAFLGASLPDHMEANPAVSVDAVLDLTIRGRIKTQRSVVLDILFVYPGIGLLPIPTPEWGSVTFDMQATLRRADGVVVPLEATATRDYSEVMYAWYPTAPAERAADIALTEALGALTRDVGEQLAALPTVLGTAVVATPAVPESVVPASVVPAPLAPVATGPTAAPRRLAVLELHDLAGLTSEEASYVTDVVRGVALHLPGTRYFVMTRENILALLPPDTDLSTCEGNCEVDTGRNIGADYVVSGQIIRFGGSLRVSLKLHDTGDARLLASGKASADSVEGLEPGVEAAAGRLFEQIQARAAQR